MIESICEQAGFAAAGGLSRSDVHSDPPSSYPYAAVAASAIHCKAFSAKARFTIVGTIVVSAIALIAGLVLGGEGSVEQDPITIMYGVFDGAEAIDGR